MIDLNEVEKIKSVSKKEHHPLRHEANNILTIMTLKKQDEERNRRLKERVDNFIKRLESINE